MKGTIELTKDMVNNPYIIRNIKRINKQNKSLLDYYSASGDMIKANIVLAKINNNKMIYDSLV